MSNQKNSDPTNIEMETLKDLKNFIELMDDNTVITIDIKVVLTNE